MLKVFEAFAGYGGGSFALRKANINFEVIGFSEIDKNAIKVYNQNHPNITNFGDIKQIIPQTLPDFDLFLGGFPCQPFAQCGYMQGTNDPRGRFIPVILDILRIKRPRFVFLENVKGLTQKKFSSEFNQLLTGLANIGYNVTYQILNTKDYGLPQNRERLYIFGSLEVPPNNFTIEPPREQMRPFIDYLDKNAETKLFKDSVFTQKQLQRVRKPIPNNTDFCFEKRGATFAPYCYTVTTFADYQLLYLKDNILRYLSVPEIARFQGFEYNDSFKEIDLCNLCRKSCIKLLGNGWNIDTVSKVFKQIFSFYNV